MAGELEAAQHDVDVTFLNASNPSMPSMMDSAIGGIALYDDVAETLTIPLQPIYAGPITAYIDGMTVELSGGSTTIPIPADEVVDEAQFNVGFYILTLPSEPIGYAPVIMALDFL